MKKLFQILLLLLYFCSLVQAEIVTATGTFKTGTGISDIVVSGLSFQPKAIVFFWNGRTETTDSVGSAHYRIGIGAATSSTDEWANSITSQDNVATTAADMTNIVTGSVIITTGSVTDDGVADVKSIDSGGFTMQVTNAFSVDYTIGYWAIGGSSITNAKAGTQTLLTTAPVVNQAYTGVGFQPDFLLISGVRKTGDSGDTGGGYITIGAGTSSSAEWVLASSTANVAGTSDTQRYFYNAEIHATGSTSMQERSHLVSMDSDGFTFSRLEGTTGYRFKYLALKGGNYSVGTLQTKTDTTDIVVSGLSFAPSGGFLVSNGNAVSTQDSVSQGAEYSMGAFTSDTSLMVVSGLDEDAIVAGTQGAAGIEFDEAYQNLSTADVTDGLMDVKTGGMGSSSVTFVMDDTDPSAAMVGYVIVGPAAAAGVVKSLSYLQMLNRRKRGAR